jgi:hypothetical protein
MNFKAVIEALENRPYCPSCKLIWGRQSLGLVRNCTQCGKPLTIKSYKPWLRILGGVSAITLGGVTIAVQQIPLIWIGGFLFGGSLVINGFRQWFKLLSLDMDRQKQEDLRDSLKKIVFTCGKCSTKFSVKRGRGETTVSCPGCYETLRLRT